MAISVPGSVRSRMGRSVDSRSSSVSRRSRLSTAEMEEMRIAAKRLEQKELRKQNERRCHKAIKYPELLSQNRSVLPLTVPKEFSLSCPATPAKSVISDGDSEVGDKSWSYSLRSVPASPRRTWEPELTVPQAPDLSTSRRSRSASAFHSGQRNRSTSRHRFPREQEAIERHMERASCAKWQYSGRRLDQNPNALDGNRDGKREIVAGGIRPDDPSMERASLEGKEEQQSIQIPVDVDLDEWVKAAATEEERAKRRRQVMVSKQKKSNDEKAAKFREGCHGKIFKGGKLSQAKADGKGVGRKSPENNSCN